MTVESPSAPKPTLSKSVLRRLSATKLLAEAEVIRLKILDKLAIPTNVDNLEMQITDWHDCNMFFPMEGLPRAYMEVPVRLVPDQRTLAQSVWGGNPDYCYERWVYSVIGWQMKAPRHVAEPLICEKMWKQFIELRRLYATKYDENQPLMVFRRHIEITEDGHKGRMLIPCFEHAQKRCKPCSVPRTRVTIRLAIPGLDLTQAAGVVPDSSALPMLEVES